MKKRRLTTYEWIVFLAVPVVLAVSATKAFADSKVYGNLNVHAGKIEGVSNIHLNSYSSQLGLKGRTHFNNNWLVSHQLEIELNTFNGTDEKEDISLRHAWLGLKTDSGEFRVGRHVSIYDIVDDGQELLSKRGQALPSLPSLRSETDVLLYVNKSGLMAYAISFEPFENNAEDRVVSGLLNYANGPFYAGLGLEKSSGLSLGSKLSLGYNKDDKYELGLTYDRQLGSSATSLTATGLYRFGKIYVGAELGKVLSGDLLDQQGNVSFTEDTKNTALELGYQWNENTKFYIDYSNLGDRKETSLAVNYKF